MINKLIIKTTDIFEEWKNKLKDKVLIFIIDKRIKRVMLGNFGDFKSVGDGVYELRFKVNGGMRIYYTFKSNVLVLLLVGGNKSTQKKDIKLAKELAKFD